MPVEDRSPELGPDIIVYIHSHLGQDWFTGLPVSWTRPNISSLLALALGPQPVNGLDGCPRYYTGRVLETFGEPFHNRKTTVIPDESPGQLGSETF
jgi:hypothetical protein